MKRALVVDDEPAICRCFEALLGDLDCEAVVAASAEEGLERAREERFDVIVLDVRLPGMDGLSALPQFRETTEAPILVMTAHGDLSTAVSVVQEGAFEYLPKPFDLEGVTRVLKRALAEVAGARGPAREGAAAGAGSGEIVGNSLPMQQLFRQIALAAQHDAPVLITGESGTGKELVAHAIHRHGARAEKPIVPVHLASVSEALMERELFGHAAGAFTGAERAEAGLISRADGGTLFLDEIGETPMGVQVKLLRTIETGEFYRVGSTATERSDFRLIAATNRSVEYLRSSDSFRADFFYRLATIQIHVPPLRARVEDIPVLAQHFLDWASGGGGRRFALEALDVLQRRAYPGNVRELKNIVVRAANETPAAEIDAEFVAGADDEARVNGGESGELRSAARQWAERALAGEGTDLLAEASGIVEGELIRAALELMEGNRSAAAQRLGIHRETLREKLGRLEG